jgi:hypothetical protein
MFRRAQDQKYISYTLISIGNLLLKEGKADEAEKKCSEAMEILEKSESREELRDVYELLYKIAEKKGDYKKALSYHVLFKNMHDSIFNESSISQMKEMEAKYESEKKDSEIKLLNKDNEKQAALAAEESRRHTIITSAVSLGLILVLGFALFMFRSYQRKKKDNIIIAQQKKEVELQKHMIEEKNKDITDSITYARRIQKALMPTENQIDKTIRRLKKD